MKLDDYSIEQLVPVINGDIRNDESEYCLGLTIHKSGRNLVDFFNNYGYRDIYNAPGVRGLPDNLSRKEYTKLKLKELNDTKDMENLINDFIFSRNYANTDYDIHKIADYINNIIKYNGYELKLIDNEYIVTGDGLIKDDIIDIEPTFENIQDKIISEIRNAKYTIWVAVAWFTDTVLFNELITKQNEGLNIQVIVLNDSKNSQIKFEDYFETHRINTFGAFDNNIFHDKFCIIDLKTVIHGSYNWSKKAQYNKEDIATVRSFEFAEKYADRFKELKTNKKILTN